MSYKPKMHSLKTFTTSLRLRNYISSTTKVVPLLFQSKVKGILPRWGRSKPSASACKDIISFHVL